MEDRVERALGRLREAERARRSAIRELINIGVIRSWGVVGDYGEYLAARYYGVEPARISNPGYDLERKDGKLVQVRTLRSTPENTRASMGVMKDPYDLLLAIRIDEDYVPVRAIEMPRSVLEAHYPPGTRTTWTKRLEADPRARPIDPVELLTEGAGAERHG